MVRLSGSNAETHPTTVYFAPFNENRVPDVFTNPVEAGADAVELALVVVCDDVEAMVLVATVLVAVPT